MCYKQDDIEYDKLRKACYEQGIAISGVVVLAIALGWVLRDKGVYFRVEQRPTVEQQK